MARAAVSVSEGSKSSAENTSSSVAASDSNLNKLPLHFLFPCAHCMGTQQHVPSPAGRAALP